MVHFTTAPALQLFLHMDPIRRGYDQWATRYDDRDPSTGLDERLILSLAAPRPGMRFLDLACGTGRYARLLSAAGAEVIGIDLSHGMLERARGSARALFQACADRLPFAAASFDGVTCGLLFDHVQDPAAPLGEVARVLRPGGRLVMSAIHPEMQRLTGPAVGAIPGFIHELDVLIAAACAVGLRLRELHEPRVDDELARDPRWAWRRGLPALAILEFSL